MKAGLTLQNSRVLIELAPTRLEIAVMNGGAVAQHFHADVTMPSELEPWLAAVAGLHAMAKEAVSAWKLKGVSAHVVYAAPSSVAVVHACPLAAGQGAAILASTLTLGESAGFDLKTNPTDAQVLARDPDGAGGEGGPSFHCLAIADREVVLAAIGDLCKACGLQLERAVPIDAATLSLAVTQALEDAGGGSAAINLHMSERSSAVVGVEKGRILFARHVSIGTDTLAAALTGEGKLTTPEGGVLRFTQAQAAELLLRTGIPGRTELVDALTGIRGDALLPLLQPAIQRLVVEIRQSIRFGLSEGARKTARFAVSGLGSRVPRLGAVIGEQINLAVTERAAPAAQVEGAKGVSAAFIGDGARSLRVNLLPAAARVGVAMKRVKRGVLVGAVVALGVLGMDYLSATRELSAARSSLVELQRQADELRPLVAIDKQVQSAQAAVASARQRMRERVPAASQWHTVLAVLGQQTPAAVRLSEVNLALSDGKPTARLQGRTYVTPGIDSNAAIKSLIDNLGGVPLVRQARLGTTQRLQAFNGIAQSFDLTVQFVDIPAAVIVGSPETQSGGTP